MRHSPKIFKDVFVNVKQYKLNKEEDWKRKFLLGEQLSSVSAHMLLAAQESPSTSMRSQAGALQHHGTVP